MLAIDITIDAATQFQTIDGFGTSLSWSTNTPYSQDAWRNMYFQDLGSSMLRFDMRHNALKGPDGDWETPVTLGTDLAANIAQFDFNTLGVGQAGLVAQAGQSKKIDDLKIIGSIWSPPHWMKGPELNPFNGNYVDADPNTPGIQYVYPSFNGSDSSGGSLIDTPENLEQFGRFVASFVAGFEQQYGVEIEAISIQNEMTLHTGYSSCVYTPALFVKAIKAVNDAFTMWGIDTKIQGPEHISIGHVNEPWQIWQQRLFIDAIKADSVAFNALDTYLTHNYAAGGASNPRSPEMWDQLWNGRPAPNNPTWPALKDDGKPLWMTETGGEDPNWTGAMLMASGLQEALTFGNVSAWLYWQTSEGTSYPHRYSLTGGTDTTADKYVAAKHFYRYVRPGAVRISATPNDPADVEVSAFLHDEQQTLTTVLINRSDTSQVVNLNLDNIHVATFDVYRQSTAGGKWVDKGSISPVSGLRTITLPANSIVTLQGSTEYGAVAGYVYNDLDNSGTYSGGDTFRANVRVWVDQDLDGVWDPSEPSKMTNQWGMYEFTTLTPGTHRIRVEAPAGTFVAAPAAGYHSVTVAAGQAIGNRTFGLQTGQQANGKISGSVFNDLDSNGSFTAGDSLMSGIRVWIDLDLDGVFDASEPNKITNQWGYYEFNNLAAGTYRIMAEAPTGYYVAAPSVGYHTVALAAGQTIGSRMFGLRLL